VCLEGWSGFALHAIQARLSVEATFSCKDRRRAHM
jgi:hypothetical protein